MPSVSEKQARTMRAAAHDAGFARRMGIDRDVAREFVREDDKASGRDKHVVTHAPRKSSEERIAMRYGK